MLLQLQWECELKARHAASAAGILEVLPPSKLEPAPCPARLWLGGALAGLAVARLGFSRLASGRPVPCLAGRWLAWPWPVAGRVANYGGPHATRCTLTRHTAKRKTFELV